MWTAAIAPCTHRARPGAWRRPVPTRAVPSAISPLPQAPVLICQEDGPRPLPRHCAPLRALVQQHQAPEAQMPRHRGRGRRSAGPAGSPRRQIGPQKLAARQRLIAFVEHQIDHPQDGGQAAGRSSRRVIFIAKPASRIRTFARTIRWASVGVRTRKARAISSVVRPQTERKVSATCPSGARADGSSEDHRTGHYGKGLIRLGRGGVWPDRIGREGPSHPAGRQPGHPGAAGRWRGTGPPRSAQAEGFAGNALQGPIPRGRQESFVQRLFRRSKSPTPDQRGQHPARLLAPDRVQIQPGCRARAIRTP